jgi:hypothetical protein
MVPTEVGLPPVQLYKTLTVVVARPLVTEPVPVYDGVVMMVAVFLQENNRADTSIIAGKIGFMVYILMVYKGIDQGLLGIGLEKPIAGDRAAKLGYWPEKRLFQYKWAAPHWGRRRFYLCWHRPAGGE